MTFTDGGFGTVAGAVYRPEELIVPQNDPEHPDPLTDQFTAVFVLPLTIEANCCCAPTVNSTVVGEIVTTTGVTMLTWAEADFVVSAWDVTVTVTTDGLRTVAGAV